MSAYICDKKHFIYLVKAATSARFNRHGTRFSWFHAGTRHYLTANDVSRCVEVANMLWLENIVSVSTRYPNDKSSATLPGPISSEAITPADFYRAWPQPEPAQVFKSIHCLEYQSCEHAGWEASEAYAFLQALARDAAHHVPGYDEAEWGAPKEPAARFAGGVK